MSQKIHGTRDDKEPVVAEEGQSELGDVGKRSGSNSFFGGPPPWKVIRSVTAVP